MKKAITIIYVALLMFFINNCQSQVTIKQLQNLVYINPNIISSSLPIGYELEHTDGSTKYWGKKNVDGGIATTIEKGYNKVQYSFFDIKTYYEMFNEIGNNATQCTQDEISNGNSHTIRLTCQDYTYKLEILMAESTPFMYSVIITKGVNININKNGNNSNNEKPNSPNGYITIVSNKVNIREMPSTNTKVLFQLNKGDVCTLLEKGKLEKIGDKTDYWYKINYNKMTGWVFGAFTSLKDDSLSKYNYEEVPLSSEDQENINNQKAKFTASIVVTDTTETTEINQDDLNRSTNNVTTDEEVLETPIFTVVEEIPYYIGGDEAKIKFLTENIKYPQSAKEKKIQGTIYVTFVIDETGKVTDVRVLRGIGGGCDEEAIRVVKLMPPWKPGKQSGKPVRVQFNMPIRFTL